MPAGCMHTTSSTRNRRASRSITSIIGVNVNVIVDNYNVNDVTLTNLSLHSCALIAHALLVINTSQLQLVNSHLH